MKYALYLGCLIPAREIGYELSARRTLQALGVDLTDISGASCCAPFSIQSLDYLSWLALASRNLCLAEEMGLNILALCNDCYESLMMVNKILKQEKGLKDQVNEILSKVGKEFKGKVEVKHMIDVLYEDVGLDKMADFVKRPLKGLRVATQPGCHLVRPRMLHGGIGLEFEALDQLVKILGAEPVSYERRDVCCGGPLRDIDDDLARSLSRDKLASIKKANIDCLITVCPFCYIQFDLGQMELQSLRKEEFNVPVLHFTELLSLAMGFDPTDVELKEHRIPITKLLQKL